MNERTRLGMAGRGHCSHPGRCASNGITCRWSDCDWTTAPAPAGWPEPTGGSANFLDEWGVNPWLLAAVLILVAACVIVIYAAVS